MSMDKLFDGSDAHLLGANAEFIADLRERINPAYADQRGTESYERKLCADALEAADKRIAELEKYGRVQDPLAQRIAELEVENERLHQVCRDAYEVWAGSEGIPEPVTCAEAYLYQLLITMRDEVKKGLAEKQIRTEEEELRQARRDFIVRETVKNEEAERKLAVAREALEIIYFHCRTTGSSRIVSKNALAQIGGDDAGN